MGPPKSGAGQGGEVFLLGLIPAIGIDGVECKAVVDEIVLARGMRRLIEAAG